MGTCRMTWATFLFFIYQLSFFSRSVLQILRQSCLCHLVPHCLFVFLTSRQLWIKMYILPALPSSSSRRYWSPLIFTQSPEFSGLVGFHIRLWSCLREPREKILILLEVLRPCCMRCGFTEEDAAESLHRSGCLAALQGLALWYNKCLYSFNSFHAEDTLLT